MPAEFGAPALHSRWAEAAAVVLAKAEADPGHSLGPVAAVRIQLPDHLDEVDTLRGEGSAGGIAGLRQQLGERHRRMWSQPDRDGVAVVADHPVGRGGPV